MAVVRIERLGGLAGMGGALSHLRSVGEVHLDALSDAERAALHALFDSDAGDAGPGGDQFRYRLTLESGASVELPGDKVPAKLKASVTDRLV